MSEIAGDTGALHDPTTHRGLHGRVSAVLIAGMEKFIEQHANRISGTLGCFDRVLFRGYLPIMSGAAMAMFLKSRDVMRETLKAFLLEQAERLESHAQDLCTQTGRPYEYLSHAARKEDLARKIAERDEITEGLVCVLSVLEPCRTFSLVWNGRSPIPTAPQHGSCRRESGPIARTKAPEGEKAPRGACLTPSR